MDRVAVRFLFCFVLAVLALPSTAHSAASIDIYGVEVDGEEISDYDKIYVREDVEIKLNFQYSVDSSSTVDKWEVWKDRDATGTLIEDGGFSGTTASVTFTTNEVNEKARLGSMAPDTGDTGLEFYSYAIVVKVVYSDSATGTAAMTDGDYDDGYFSPSVESGGDGKVNDRPTQTITIHVDMDPPSPVVLKEEVEPGESSLIVFWEEGTMSVSGNEELDIKVVFCVRKADEVPEAKTGLARLPLVIYAGDADLDLGETLSSDPDRPPLQPDGDKTLPDGDAPPTIDGDKDRDIDLPPAADGDGEGGAGDGDPAPGWSDGDADGSDGAAPQGPEDLYGCMEPMPEADSSEGNSYRIDGLENDARYKIRAKAVDLAGNESQQWSNAIYGTPMEVNDFWEAYKSAEGAEDGGFCFIATAAYGSDSNEQVRLLRLFRDRVLAKFSLGRTFIAAYYRHSPPVAQVVAGHPILAGFVRSALSPFVVVLYAVFSLSIWSQIGIVLLTLLALIGRNRMLARAEEELR